VEFLFRLGSSLGLSVPIIDLRFLIHT
jgi:hypothetical protein